MSLPQGSGDPGARREVQGICNAGVAARQARKGVCLSSRLLLISHAPRRLPALGPTVTGKVHSGQIHKGDKISCLSFGLVLSRVAHARRHGAHGPSAARVSEARAWTGRSWGPARCAKLGSCGLWLGAAW